MQSYPHTYGAEASGTQTGTIAVISQSLPVIETAPPPQFDGPPGLWSPETLLCAAIADCFVLTFRGITRAARVDWLSLDCRVEGTLERLDGITQFTRFVTTATLTVPPDVDVTRARALLEATDRACLVSNSLRAKRLFEMQVISGTP